MKLKIRFSLQGIKRFLAVHVEKVIAAIALLFFVILAFGAMTRSGDLPLSPNELQETAASAEEHIDSLEAVAGTPEGGCRVPGKAPGLQPRRLLFHSACGCAEFPVRKRCRPSTRGRDS